jgi:superfamily II DNA/RNA helicase
LSRLQEVEDAVGRVIAEGKRAYWVCPLVEESEKIDLAAAQARFEALREKFGDQVALVHGRMKGSDKDAAMARFAVGESRLLIATTVIEVCSTRRHSEKPQKRVSPFCAKQKTASASPRRICGYAAKAMCWEHDRAGFPVSGSRGPKYTENISVRPVTTLPLFSCAIQLSRHHAARRCGRCFIFSGKMKRSS